MHQQRRWEEHLPLVEFPHKNGHQESLKMSPFEELYTERFHTPFNWSDIVNKVSIGPNMFEEVE